MLILIALSDSNPVNAALVNWADSSDRRNTIFVGLSGDTGTVPRIASL
jgi:hypothetical protein